MMSCSWEDNMVVNNIYMYIRGHVCSKNVPTLIQLDPGQAKVYKATLMRSFSFSYVSGPQVATTKIGLVIIDDIFNPGLHRFDYYAAMQDKSRWQIVWSNALYLLPNATGNGKSQVENGSSHQ
jgi:hypothetical protein